MAAELDPYRDWLGITEPRRPLSYYQILNLPRFETDGAAIELAAERQIAVVRGLIDGAHARLARRTLFELEAAKKCLLDPANKRTYDESLKSGSIATKGAAAPAAIAAQAVASAPSAGPKKPPAANAEAVKPSKPKSRMAELLDEEFPVETPPEADRQLFALRVTVPRKKQNPVLRNTIAVGLFIVLPAIGIVGVVLFGISWLESRLASSGDPRVPISVPIEPGPSDPVVRRRPSLQEIPSAAPFSGQSGFGPFPAPEAGPVSTRVVAPQSPASTAQPVPPPDLDDASIVRRLPPPDAAALVAAQSKARAALANELSAADSASKKAHLAETLSDRADHEADSTVQFALLEIARGLAIEAGDARLLRQVVDEMAAHFDVDAMGLKFAGFRKLFEHPLPTDLLQNLVQTSAILVDRLAESDRYDEAVALARLAFQGARDLGNERVVSLLAERGRDLVESQKRFLAARAALIVLRDRPNDPLANQQAGEWYWFDKTDRERGLNCLAKGANPGLQAVAVEALNAPRDSARQLALADAWWEIGHGLQGGAKRTAILREALRWYRKAQAQAPAGNSPAYRRIVELEREVGSRGVPALVIDLDQDSSKLSIGDEESLTAAALEIELRKIEGFSPTPSFPKGPQKLTGGAPLRLLLREAEPRVELQFQAKTVNGQQLLLVSPVYFETSGNAFPLSNQRINSLAGRLQDQVAATRQRLAGVGEQIQSLQLAGTTLTNYSPATAAENTQKVIRLHEMQNDLKRLFVQQKSLARSLAPLEYRLAILPALTDMQHRIHGSLAIGFAIRSVDKAGNKTVLLETN